MPGVARLFEGLVLTLSPIRRISLALSACTLLLGACVTLPSVGVERELAAGRYADAATLADKAQKDYGSKSQLLYLMDSAWALHLKGDYQASNQKLELARRLVDELYTKSLRSEALSFVGNDMDLPYRGEPHEQVLLHTLALLNYSIMGQSDAALVEARRADQRLKAQVQEHPGASYQEDALARTLSSLLYEGQGGQALWDAYIDAKKADKAAEAYAKNYATPRPTRLDQDLYRLASGLGESADAQAFAQRLGGRIGGPSLKELATQRAEAVVILFEGMAPFKVSESVTLPINLSDGTAQYAKLALPRFVSRTGPVAEAWVEDAQGRRSRAEMIEDLASIAVRDLNERRAGIMTKATTRMIAKFQAARAIQQKSKDAGAAGELLAFLGTNIYTLASEVADLRSWRSFAGRVYLARMDVAPGTQALRLRVQRGGQETLIELPAKPFRVGSKVFFSAYLP